MVICTKERCRQKENMQTKYIGESERTLKLKERVCEHIGYINTKKLNQPAGEHFNIAVHTKADMRVVVLEKVKSLDLEYRKERESHLIRKLNTFYKGLSKKP